MMSNTPRVFVGTTTFLIAGITGIACGANLQSVIAAINEFPGVRGVAADQAGLGTVTADLPVNRSDLAAAIVGAGCTVVE